MLARRRAMLFSEMNRCRARLKEKDIEERSIENAFYNAHFRGVPDVVPDRTTGN
jgi:hypothetical protein